MIQAHAPAYVLVSGPADTTEGTLALAERVGRLLAEAGAVVLTGGLGGVMAAASRGAGEAGGEVLALLPGTDRSAANPWVGHALPTGLGQGRNLLLVTAADAVIAIGGSWGTLTEVAHAKRLGRPVIGLGTWSLTDAGGEPVDDGLVPAETPDAAVAAVLALLGRDADHG